MSACVAMAPMPAAMKGTRAPTAKNLVATAMAKLPVALSRAMIDHVMRPCDPLASRRVTLHAARVGSGAPPSSVARGSGEPALGPIRTDLHDVAAFFQFIDRRPRNAIFNDEHARAGGAWPERDRKMLRMPSRRVDRLLQVHLAVHVAQEEQRI